MAIPGILMQMAKSNPMLQQIKQTMNVLQSAQNPQALLNQMAMNNPNIQKVMEIINKNGGDISKAFYSTAEEMGVNPQDVLDMMK